MRNPGEYNKKIIIYQEIVEKDSDGFKKTNNVTVLETYAKVITTKGYAIIANNSDFEKAYTNFTIRFPKTEINSKMKIKYKNKIYDIEYLNNVDEKDEEIEMQCKVVDKK